MKAITYENAINNVLQVLDNSTNIINFLSENKGKWKKVFHCR